MTQLSLPPTLAADLEAVDRIVRERTRSRAAVISVAGSQLLQAEAERLRAALVLLSADLAGDYASERVLHAAAAVELIYAATQTHDDLVDAAERRRGVPRTEEWSNGVALMVGDYLFALAAVEMSLSPDARVIGIYSQAVMQICEAQLAPPTPLRPLVPAREQHLAQIAGTSAALLGAACRAGGICSGATPEQAEALGSFGEQLGLARAIAAELNEFAAHADDYAPSLDRGLVTLPLIYAADAGDGARLAAALDGGDPAELRWATVEALAHGLAPARAELARRVAAAHAALAPFPATPARAALLALAEL